MTTFFALLSLIPPSTVKGIGTYLLLIGLAGDVALVAVHKWKALERWMSLVFTLIILLGVWLEYVGDRPRALSAAGQERITVAAKAFAGTPYDFMVQLDPEALDLMESIGSALDAAGWVRKPAPGLGFIIPGKPTAGITAFAGLEIQITDSKQAEWGANGKAATILWHALQQERLTTTAKHVPDNQERSDAIHIKVGSKP